MILCFISIQKVLVKEKETKSKLNISKRDDIEKPTFT